MSALIRKCVNPAQVLPAHFLTMPHRYVSVLALQNYSYEKNPTLSLAINFTNQNE